MDNSNLLFKIKKNVDDETDIILGLTTDLISYEAKTGQYYNNSIWNTDIHVLHFERNLMLFVCSEKSLP